MHRDRTVLLVFLFNIGFASQTVAQTSAPMVLTVDQAIRLAVQHNHELAAVRLEVERADAKVREAHGYAFPAFDLSSQYLRALKRPVFFLPDFQDPNSGRTVPIRVGSNHAVEVGLNARQILFNATVIVGVGAAKVYSSAAREMYKAKELETIANVRRAYYGVLLAHEVAKMMQVNLKNAEDNLNNVQIMRRQGLLSEYDELRATVGVENLRPTVLQAENNYALAMDGLRAAIGISTEESFIVNDTLALTPIDDATLAAAYGLSVENNPVLNAARLQIEVNKAFVSAEQSNYLPTLAAFGSYQYQAAKNSLNISTRDFITSSVVGLSLSVNLFQGLQTRARVDQAQVEVRKSEERLSNVETQLRVALHSVISQLHQARKRYEAQQRTIEQAERGYAIATTRFLAGSGTQLEVNDAQLALTQAKVNRMQAIYDYAVASAEFEQLIGRRPEHIPEVEG